MSLFSVQNAKSVKGALFMFLYVVLAVLAISALLFFAIFIPCLAVYELFEIGFYKHVSNAYGAFISFCCMFALIGAMVKSIFGLAASRFKSK